MKKMTAREGWCEKKPCRNDFLIFFFKILGHLSHFISRGEETYG